MKIQGYTKAFTLPEMLVWLTIIAILSTIGFISYSTYTSKSRDTARSTDLKNITTILSLNKTRSAAYPTPTQGIDVTYSGAIVWTQGVFGIDTMRETGKIFWELRDPKYGNQYTYSVTANKKEYQLWAVFEREESPIALLGYQWGYPQIFQEAYAAEPFDPLELSPKVWLDAMDMDGDGDTADNPANNTVVTSWVNKSSAGSANNPVITTGTLRYATSGFNSNQRSIFIPENAWLRLTNSNITQGDIFYVAQKRDPFASTDSNGLGLQSSTTSNFLIGHSWNYRHALRINSAPNHASSSPASTSNRTNPYIYSFHTDGTNYSFLDTGNSISQGAMNSITGNVWAFNAAGAVNNQGSDLVVSEILIFDQKLSDTNRQKVEWYLAHKWGRVSILPSWHPYKVNPPESSGPPVPPDTTPDAFIFSDVTDAQTSTLFSSNTITLSGFNTLTSVTISWSGAQYSINGWAFTSATGSVSVGNTLQVRLTSSSLNSTTSTATLTVWGVSETYSVTTLVADMTPDAFTFSSVSDANIGTSYTSNVITVTWLNVSVPVNISGTGAQYRILDGIPADATGSGTVLASTFYDGSNTPERAFDNNTSTSGWGNNNVLPAWIRYDFWEGNNERITKYTLYRNSSQNGSWNSNNNSPRNWTFEASQNGTDWTVLDTQSNQTITTGATKQEYSFTNTVYYRYYRLNISAVNHASQKWVNITEMELIHEWGWAYTTAQSLVQNGNILAIRMPAAPTPATSRVATLSVWSGAGTFTITTVPPDTTPDNFSFTSVTNASLGASYTSETVGISGINTATPISISWAGLYRINAGPYLSTGSTIQNGDVVSVQQSASASNSVTVSSTLNIGGVTAVYNVTTPAPPPDPVPDAFSFQDITNATPSTIYTSDAITISGTNTGSSISISGGQYRKNGTGAYTSSAGTVQNGDTITVQVTSSATPGNAVNAILTIQGVSDTFTVTTVPPDTTPDPFTFSIVSDAELNREYISNPVTITWINAPTSINISGGGGRYNINGWPWRNNAGTVNQWDVITVRLQSLVSGNSNVSTSLNVGWYVVAYDITSLNPDTTPDAFVFQDVSDATLSTNYISNTLTITGINTPVPVSITGGQYRISSTGSFTSATGTISNGQTITVQLTSAPAGGMTENAILTLGWVSDTYSVQTQAFTLASQNLDEIPTSNVYVTWNYNGLFVHGKLWETHYVVATPSIMAYDLSNPDILHLLSEKKLVYDGFLNLPSSYSQANLPMSGGFDFTISAPLLYEWSREDLGAYGGLKQIDEGVKSTYNTFPAYPNIASYMDDYSLGYLENIIGWVIGINPIKPFYCSDILRSKLISNIAPEAKITASPSAFNTYGTWGIANGITSTVWDLDYEYHSQDGNASIFFEWETTKKIGYIKIYNRTGCCTNRLSGANIKLFGQDGNILYSHSLWDTTGDYVVDLDLEWIGQLYDVKVMSIQTVGGNQLNLREVEVYLGGNIQDGVYKVDKDGLGGQSPYNVYCDMTTDGGWWTRIGENYITNGNFENQNNVGEHTFTGASLWANVIVAHATVEPPSSIPDAFVMQHNGGINDPYQLFFDDIPGEYFAQEIRLSAWVKGTNSSLFHNTVDYGGSTSVTQPDYDVIEQIGDWKYQMVRIPLTGLVQDFTWDIAKNVSGLFHFTGLKMEVYYR